MGCGSEPIHQSSAEASVASSPGASDEGQAPLDVKALARSHPKYGAAEEGIYVEANQRGPEPPKRGDRPEPMPPQRPGQTQYKIPYQLQGRYGYRVPVSNPVYFLPAAANGMRYRIGR